MITKRTFTAALLATIALPAIAFADGDAPNFGNCAPTGEAGSISLTTVEPDTLIVATVLPTPAGGTAIRRKRPWTVLNTAWPPTSPTVRASSI